MDILRVGPEAYYVTFIVINNEQLILNMKGKEGIMRQGDGTMK